MITAANLTTDRRAQAPVAGDRGGDVEPCDVLVLEAGESGLDHIADLPYSGALVHVLVQPFVAGGEVELLDQAGEAGVDGTEEGDDPLEELRRHEALGLEHPVQIVQAVGEEGVEAIDGGGSIHGRKERDDDQ